MNFTGGDNRWLHRDKAMLAAGKDRHYFNGAQVQVTRGRPIPRKYNTPCIRSVRVRQPRLIRRKRMIIELSKSQSMKVIFEFINEELSSEEYHKLVVKLIRHYVESPP